MIVRNKEEFLEKLNSFNFLSEEEKIELFSLYSSTAELDPVANDQEVIDILIGMTPIIAPYIRALQKINKLCVEFLMKNISTLSDLELYSAIHLHDSEDLKSLARYNLKSIKRQRKFKKL